jgi:hypothetical protein
VIAFADVATRCGNVAARRALARTRHQIADAALEVTTAGAWSAMRRRALVIAGLPNGAGDCAQTAVDRADSTVDRANVAVDCAQTMVDCVDATVDCAAETGRRSRVSATVSRTKPSPISAIGSFCLPFADSKFLRSDW